MFGKGTKNILIGCVILLFILYFSYAHVGYENFQDSNTMKPKGVIIELIGGLGNQLYIYAAGRVIQEHLNVPMYLVSSGTVRAHTDVDYRSILFTDFTPIEKDDDRMKDKVDVRLHNDFWNSWSMDKLPTDTDKYIYISDQWFQYFPAIEGIIPKLRQQFVMILRNKYPDIRIQPRSAFIHVRRGDYTTEQNNVYLLDIDYYLKAIDIFKEKENVLNFYVFSDEINWCKKQNWDTTKNIIYVDEADELKAIYMMSQCKEGAIIANSTFSSWGAILGPYETGATIVYPSKWLYNAKTDFPKEWIKI